MTKKAVSEFASEMEMIMARLSPATDDASVVVVNVKENSTGDGLLSMNLVWTQASKAGQSQATSCENASMVNFYSLFYAYQLTTVAVNVQLKVSIPFRLELEVVGLEEDDVERDESVEDESE